MDFHSQILSDGWPEGALSIPFGSQVYGTARSDSDFDYLVVFPHDNGVTGCERLFGRFNFQTYNQTDLQRQLEEHQIHALEVYFVPGSPLPGRLQFTLNLSTLRHSLSQKSSHSFVKAKKKIQVEQDFRTGWKSLFHALRIIVFGIELARTGALTDFSAANAYWDEIWAAQETDWTRLHARWHPVHNALTTEFRKLAPKE